MKCNDYALSNEGRDLFEQSRAPFPDFPCAVTSTRDQIPMKTRRAFFKLTVVACVLVLELAPLAEIWAGCCLGFRNRSVGGVNISPEGILVETTPAFRNELRQEMLKEFKPIPMGMQVSAPLRKISLRGIALAIDEAKKNNMGIVPDEVKYLGGLQRIQYILVYPEHQDIVLAGPGEGWKVDAAGNVVGETTNRPVLQLDDLIIALRTVDQARNGGISCSIDPTAEGRQRLEQFLETQRVFSPDVVEGVEQALGMQQVTLTGVPEDSHFARMLVAADYRMKRYGMKLEPAPVRGLPSYLDLVRSANSNMTPRWWMACNYEPVLRSEDGLAWELRGQGVKVLTEDEFVAEDGTVRESGKTSGPAERWAQMMTEKYEELSAKEPVFGELRNLMDLCVTAAVIAKNDLANVAGCDLSSLTRREGGAMVEAWNPPKKIATQCSFVKHGGRYVIAASGGVQIESWQVASNEEMSSKPADVRKQSASSASNWWWH
jgi:hypothetical protein